MRMLEIEGTARTAPRAKERSGKLPQYSYLSLPGPVSHALEALFLSTGFGCQTPSQRMEAGGAGRARWDEPPYGLDERPPGLGFRAKRVDFRTKSGLEFG